MTEGHTKWKSETGYILSLLGTAVGFANLLGFSSQCYRNGGAAFLIPFVIAMATLGVPMLVLEGVVGQKLKLPLVSAYGHVVGRPGRFFAWLAVITVATIGAFYSLLTGWSLLYAFFSGAGWIPPDTERFFTESVLHDSGALTRFGAFSLPSFVGLCLVGPFTVYVLSQNIQVGIERWCTFFLPMLGVLIVVFTGAVMILPGSFDGFYYYLKPDFSQLANFRLWRDVFGHLFFSFSLGIGIVVGYSRHTDISADIRRAMLQVAVADFLISFLSGFIIFGCLGYLSKIKGVPFESIVHAVSIFDIGFELFPLLMQQFGELPARILGPIFFFCLFIAGITGVFSIVESVSGNIQVEFERSRKTASLIACAAIFLLATPFCMGNGVYIIDALSPMVLGNIMLIGGISQIVVFMYRAKAIRKNSIWFVGKRRSLSFYSLKFFSPLLLVIILFFAVGDEIRSGFAEPEMLRWTWFLIASITALKLASFHSTGTETSL